MNKRIFTVAASDPRTLPAFLQARLQLSENRANALLCQGAVWRNGRRVEKSATALLPGERITVYLDVETAQPPAPAPRVIFEDSSLLVVDKPAGLQSQPGRRGGPSVLSQVPPPHFLIHRLDADASGLLVLARNQDSAAALQTALLQDKIVREYLAVTAGRPSGSDGSTEGFINLRIGRAQAAFGAAQTSHSQCFSENSPHGQTARTFFRLVAFDKDAQQSLLHVRIFTGRMHQIRVHLAALGHPLLGDRLYGGAPFSRLLLHAHTLRFAHPRTGAPLCFSTPFPADFPPFSILEAAPVCAKLEGTA